MTPAEEVFVVPELLELIASFLESLDIIRLVRVNSWCYRNIRSSIPVKKQLWYLPPDLDDLPPPPIEEENEDNDPPVHFNRRRQQRQSMIPERWPHPLDLRLINPTLSRIFPGCVLRNFSNGLALLIVNALPPATAKIRASWKAMLLTAQPLASLHLEPCALYSPPKWNPDGDNASSSIITPNAPGTTLPPSNENRSLLSPSGRTGHTDPLGDNRWVPDANGWLLDIEAHLQLHERLRKLPTEEDQGGFNAFGGWGIGSVNPRHWTEYLAIRRGEWCDGWIWGESLVEFGSDGYGLAGRGPKYGYFEEEVLPDDGLVRCGQVGREIRAAGWHCWMLRGMPE